MKGGRKGIAGNQVQQAGSRGTKSRAVGVVAHRKRLRVVPERCDGVAVEVTHHQRTIEVAIRKTHIAEAALAYPDGFREFVHESLIERRLLGSVVVVLVAGGSLTAVQPEGIRRIRIVGEQVP